MVIVIVERFFVVKFVLLSVDCVICKKELKYKNVRGDNFYLYYIFVYEFFNKWVV